MDPRLLYLGLPSLAILALLGAHSAVALPRRRRLAFWGAVAVYGVARGAAVRWIAVSGLGARAPYVVHRPLAEVWGVSLQEVAGWAIVVYLGWWLGARLTDRLYAQVAWAAVFLGAAAWAVETAAVAAGWWHWTLPLARPWLEMPAVGLVDWALVGVDFLLPFAALTAPPPATAAARRRRWLTLLAFPAHFAGHLWVAELGPAFPAPGLHLVHWLLAGAVLALALGSGAEDRPFAGEPAGWWGRVPAVALAAVVADVAAVELVAAGRPGLVVSVSAVLAVAVVSWRPRWAPAVAVAAVAGAVWRPALLLAAVPPLLALGLTGFRRLGHDRPRRPRAVAAVLVALAVAALAGHHHADRRRRALTGGLDAALAARDRGALDEAARRLEALAAAHPGSAVPSYLLGEILYKTDRPAAARPRFAEAVEIDQSLTAGYRFLAVIHLRLGDRRAAAAAAERGLEVAPGDLELAYLAGRAGRAGGARGAGVEALWPEIERRGPEAAAGLAGLAFEVGDAAAAAAIADRALERWPAERELYRLRLRLARAAGDRATAERLVETARVRGW